MRKYITLLLVLAISSVAGADTMIISGLPGEVNTSAGSTVLSFDIVSDAGDPWLDNDSLYIYTYAGGTLDVAAATNNVVPGELYPDGNLEPGFLDFYVDITGVTEPAIWADTAIPQGIPQPIVGDIISDLGLTIPQDFIGMIDVKVLSEGTGVVEDVFTINAVIPEPATMALLGLGGLFLRRRK